MMYNIECFVLIFNICLTCVMSSAHSGYKYYSNAGGWLKVHEIPLNWQEAMIRCRLEGSVLASPINEDVGKVMQQIQLNTTGLDAVFTGISSLQSFKYFVSVEGVPLEDMGPRWVDKWAYFNQTNAKKCVFLDYNGKIGFVECSAELPYFCYKKKRFVALTGCGTFDKAYKRYDPTETCYKYHSERLPFDKAYLTCQSESGHLLIINSEAEAKVVDIYKDNIDNEVYIGNRLLNSWFRQPLTIEGQLLSEAGYENIAPNELSKFENETLCGTLSKEKYQKFTFCHNTLPFICEKDPNLRIFDI